MAQKTNLVKLENGKKFEPIMKFWEQVKWFFSPRNIPEVYWRDIDSKIIYRFDYKRGRLIPLYDTNQSKSK